MVNSIAILCRGGLKEVLCGLPLVSLCRARFPGAKLTLFVDEEGSPLIPFLQGPDQIVVIPKGARAQWKKAWELRKEKFDFMFTPPTKALQKRDFFTYVLRAKRKERYQETGFECRKHQAVKGLNLVDRELEEVPHEFFPKLHHVPCFTFPEKTLLVRISDVEIRPEKYQHMLHQLYRKKPFHLILSGTRKEWEKGRDFGAGMKIPYQVMITEQMEDFLQLLASVDGCLVEEGDTAHLAAALDIPQVALFGGTHVWKWAPLSEKAICLENPEQVSEIPEEEIEVALEKILG
jgi:ADP-heptose:LPS heptosyltransferase